MVGQSHMSTATESSYFLLLIFFLLIPEACIFMYCICRQKFFLWEYVLHFDSKQTTSQVEWN